MAKLLVVVDYQVDFVSGALGFAGAEHLEAGIVKEVEKTLSQGDYVLFTRDAHPEEYLATREGRHLPIPHCVKGSEGHALFGSLHAYEEKEVPHVLVMDKPTFGSAEIGEVAKKLCGGEPEEIVLCGLVTDICIIANAIILHSTFQTAHVRVIEGLVGSGNAENARCAVALMRGMGIDVS